MVAWGSRDARWAVGTMMGALAVACSGGSGSSSSSSPGEDAGGETTGSCGGGEAGVADAPVADQGPEAGVADGQSSGGPDGPMGGVPAVRAAAFTRSIGVELHMNNTGTPYGTLSTVESALAYLNPSGVGTGVATVRDDTLSYDAGITDIAALGYALDIYAWYASPGSNSWSQQAPWLQTLRATGELRFLEGPLEVDNQGWGIAVHATTYTSADGATYSGWQAPVAWQRDLFANYGNQTDVALFSLADPTDGSAGSPAVAAASQLGTTIDAVTSCGNVHYYPPDGYSPGDVNGDTMSNVIGQETGYTPGKPFAITEAGFTTIAGEGYQGNSYVNGVYTLDLVLDAFASGATFVSIYELFDESGIYPGSAEGGFGMFDANGNPKDAATDVRSLMSVLGDSGATATTFHPGSLPFTVSGLASPGQSLLLQKSNGAFELVLWSDASIFVGGIQTVAPTQNVVVNLGATHGTVNVYEPTMGATPIRTLSHVSSVALSVTDAAQIVEVVH